MMRTVTCEELDHPPHHPGAGTLARVNSAGENHKLLSLLKLVIGLCLCWSTLLILVLLVMMMFNLVILESLRRRDSEQVHAVPRQGAAQQPLMMVVLCMLYCGDIRAIADKRKCGWWWQWLTLFGKTFWKIFGVESAEHCVGWVFLYITVLAPENKTWILTDCSVC